MSFDLDSSLEVLARTPATLDTLLSGLEDRWIRATEGPGTFSPFDVVGHLIDGEETDWVPRVRIILAQEPGSTFAPYDRFRHHTRNLGRPLTDLLAEFRTLRAANLAEVRAWGLSERQLALEGLHPSFGPVTLRQLLATWVAHDLGHLAQVARVMAKRYTRWGRGWLIWRC